MRLIWQMSETAQRLKLDKRLWDLDEGYVTPPGRVFVRNAERLYGLWFTTTNAALAGVKIEESYRQSFNDPNATQPKTFQGKAYADSLETGSEAILVMLVASLEAYLRDVLTFAAQQDPTLMKHHPVEITYESDDIAAWSSIDAIRAALPEQWAKEWLRRRPSPSAMVGGLRRQCRFCTRDRSWCSPSHRAYRRYGRRCVLEQTSRIGPAKGREDCRR